MFYMTGSVDPFGEGPELPQNNSLRLVVKRLAKLPIRCEVVRFDDGPDDVAGVVGRGDDQVLIVRENATHTFMVASQEVQTFAIGEDAVSSAVSALSIGDGASASGANATAFGLSAAASGINSAAIGTGAVASGTQSIAIGGDGTVSDGVGASASSP